MIYRLLLVDGTGEARAPHLRIRTLRQFPGQGLSVHFRPVRNDRLFESARFGGQLGYRILSGEGIVRSQLWVEYEVTEEHSSVVGRSSDLLFALALITSKWTAQGAAPAAIAATGVLDVQGAVLSVEHIANKVSTAVRELESASNAIVFYPAADSEAIESWRVTTDIPTHVKLKAVAHLEEALTYLGYMLDRVYLSNPFRGLEHFDFEHHAIFFGREREVGEVIEQLLHREQGGLPGLLVEGPSGSGKSSFLRAGILPALVNPRHQSMQVQSAIRSKPISYSTRRAIWRPGLVRKAIDEAGLAQSIRSCWESLPEWTAAPRANESESLSQLAQSRHEHWPTSLRFVWLIDQLEELLALKLNDELLEAFGRFLGELQRDGVWTLASLRADAMPEFKRFDSLRRVFSAEAQYYLPTVRGLAIDEVIRRPAVSADLIFGEGPDGTRVDQLLRDEAYREQDSLPLLQFTLNELYLSRVGQELSYLAYQKLGGLSGSLETRAAAILEAETHDELRTRRHLFRCLVSVDESGRPSRRYAPMEEFAADLQQKAMVIQLVQARLCVTDQREGQAVVAFAHDALLRTLPPLIEWLNEEAALLQTRELAQRDTRLWQQHGQSAAWLATADRTASFASLQAAEVALPENVRTFVDRSRRQVLRTKRIKQAAVSLIGILAIAASISAWIATRNEHEAEFQTAQTLTSQMLLLTETAAERLKDGDLALARGIVLEVLGHGRSLTHPDPAAVDVFQSIRANDPALTILVGHKGPVRRAVYSPDGAHIVTASYDRTARIWDARTGIELAALSHPDGAVFSANYSPDGSRIVTASRDRTARIWDAHTGRQLLVLTDTLELTCAVYSPDGLHIATVSEKEIEIWNAQTGARVATFSVPGVRFGTPNTDAGFLGAVAYSPDGRRVVATMEDRTVREWDVRSGAIIAVLSGHTESVATAAYSPDGSRIVTAGDHTARVWDAATGRQLLLLSGHQGYVWSAAYSPDGKTIATSSPDKTARLWDAETGAQLQVFSGHIDILCDAAFSPDGSYLVTAGWEGVARTWALHAGPKPTILQHADEVEGVAYSPNGTQLATVSMDNAVRVWDMLTGIVIATLHSDHYGFNTVAYSPDGTHILTASSDKTVRIWNAATGAPERMLTGPAAVVSASYSPDGQRIVASFIGALFGVWDLRTGTLSALPPGHHDTIATAVFSPDGSRILTGSVDKTARIWDSVTLRPLQLLQHSDFVNAAEYSKDGSRILTSGNDRTARIWDARTGEQIGVLAGHRGFVFGAAFSPDGNRIVTGSRDATVRVWGAHTGIQLAAMIGHDQKITGVAYSPDGAHIASASADRTVRIWDARIPADFPSQVAWEEAAEADSLSNVQRTQLGLAPTAALLADVTLTSYASKPLGAALSATHASPCDRAAGAYYDPDRRAEGVQLDRIDADMTLSACAALTSARHPLARAVYQEGRAHIAKGEFSAARRDLERSVSQGYRAAKLDLAMLLTDPRAKMLDPTRALILYEQAWKQGVSMAGFRLGQLYEHGVATEAVQTRVPKDAAMAWSWYQRAATARQPDALARFGEGREHAALEAHSEQEMDVLLLQAFKFYAQAVTSASAEQWPDVTWRDWRYRRSSLARQLANEGLMQEVADAYQHVLAENQQPSDALSRIFNAVHASMP